MIDVIATRRTTLNGKTYEKDARCQMTLAQFEALEPTGRFKRAPAEKKAPAATKPKTAKKPEMTISDYVDGYLAKRWGETPPKAVIQFAANNAAEIEQEFQRRAKASD